MYKNMLCKKLIFIFVLFFSLASAFAAETKNPPQKNAAAAGESGAAGSDQQINDFSLSGYGEKGKKTWDISGKTADIYTDVVKLQEVVGNMYGKDEDIKLTADKGDFNKEDGKVHMQDNVVITTTKGTKLTTDSLDWDRKNQLVSTADQVNIYRDNMVAVATGAKGAPNLKKVALEKDVKLDINPEKNADQGSGSGIKEKINISCDGPLEIDYEKSIAVLYNNVKVERQDSVIYSDRMDIYFATADKKNAGAEPAGEVKPAGFMGSKIDKIIARGHVKVVRGENISLSEEAIYSASDNKLILSGKPKLVIYSTEGMNAPSGN